ncbi:hypothetical protein Trco_004913 [Trichoderma cornu-damae]|uniref:Uncharacterized protein n=1 Tax=Trichoderma cornu-damae TaxID=654480 RepID=A0A9P8QM58_9HYPO|nr:hypothetical protein Trco_004913 [Trichoderma cornu-damae]
MRSNHYIYILEGWICQIGLLIVHGLGVKLASVDGLDFRFAGGRRLRVAHAVEDPQQNGHDDGSAGDAEDGDLGGQILGLVLGLERLRADDVGDGEGNGDDGVDGDLFGVSLGVGADQGVDESQGSHVEVDEVDAGQGAASGGGKGHERGADDGRDQERNDAQPARQVVVDGVGAGEGGEDGDGAGGYVEERRLHGRQEDGVDDGGREGGDDAGGDDDENGVEEEQPDLEVLEGVPDAGRVEDLVAGAGLVSGQRLLDQGLFVLGQELGLADAAGHEEDDGDGDDEVEGAHGHEHDAPALEGRGPRAVLGGPGDEASEDLPAAQAAVPDAGAQGGLLLVVPLRRDHDEGRRDDGLEGAQESPDGGGAGEVLGRGRGGDDDAPEQDVEAQHLGHGELLDQVALGKLGEGVADEEGGGHPGEVVADEVEVLGDAHDVGVVDEHLVEELQEVAEEHERHDVHVDLSVDGLELLRLGRRVVWGRARM